MCGTFYKRLAIQGALRLICPGLGVIMELDFPGLVKFQQRLEGWVSQEVCGWMRVRVSRKAIQWDKAMRLWEGYIQGTKPSSLRIKYLSKR